MKKLLATGHRFPLTRRELIAHGLVSAAGLVLSPSVFAMTSRGECEELASPWMPFLVFDCAGGAGLAGNWVVGKKGGSEDVLSNYGRMGVPKGPAQGAAVDNRFGAPFHTEWSKLREGLIASASAEALANLRMGVICTMSQDDSTENMLSPLTLISLLGLRGRHIATGLGDNISASGGRSRSVKDLPQWKPILVRGADDVLDSLSLGPSLKTLTVAQRENLAKTVSRLSGGQLDRLRKLPFGEELASVARCGYLKNEKMASPIEGTDPRLDANCQKIYGIQANTASLQAKVPAIVYNVVQGNSGPGVITIEGCDYHDGTQTTGDNKDREIGTQIGRAVELAHRSGKPLFFAVISDGSTYSDNNTRNWRGDAGSHGIAVAGFYRPGSAPVVHRTQLGYFTKGQAVERSTFVGSDPRRAAHALFLNYLAVHGQVGAFSKFVPEADFAGREIDAHLIFA